MTDSPLTSLSLDALLRETERLTDQLFVLAADIDLNEYKWTATWQQDVEMLRAVAALLPELARRLREMEQREREALDAHAASFVALKECAELAGMDDCVDYAEVPRRVSSELSFVRADSVRLAKADQLKGMEREQRAYDTGFAAAGQQETAEQKKAIEAAIVVWAVCYETGDGSFTIVSTHPKREWAEEARVEWKRAHPDSADRVVQLVEVTGAAGGGRVADAAQVGHQEKSPATVPLSAEDFTQSFDAQVWALAFVERVKRHPYIATDVATMTGWFANAIMRGFDEHSRRHTGVSAQRSTASHSSEEPPRAG